MTDPKVRIQQLTSDLQKSTAPEAHSARELISLLIERTKHSLVFAEGDIATRLQGEAQALIRLHTSLTRASITLPTRE